MRWLFELMSLADVATPIVGFVQTFAHDPTPLQTNSWTFFLPYSNCMGAGYNERDIRGLLKENGINSWGSQIDGIWKWSQLMFTVSIEDAEKARNLMAERGIPLSPISQYVPGEVIPTETWRRVMIEESGMERNLRRAAGISDQDMMDFYNDLKDYWGNQE